jgi:L-asparaginase
MQAKNQKIVVLGTGGTIAGESASANEGLTYKAAQRGTNDLLAVALGPQELWPESLLDCQFDAEQVAQLDSKDMDFETWIHLAQRCEHWLAQSDVTGLVITHGTDTLEETAYFLSQVLNSSKPIVLTCAMRPANFKDADGPQNLKDALLLAATTKGQGVWMVAAGEIHHSQYVHKVHPTRLHAFDSGEIGLAGRVINDQVQWLDTFCTPICTPLSTRHLSVSQLPHADQWPWIEIVMNHVNASALNIDALVQAGVKGLVVAGTGNGSVSSKLKASLALAQEAGVEIRLATRCNQSTVIPTESHVFDATGGLSPVKTRVALLLEMLSKQQDI